MGCTIINLKTYCRYSIKHSIAKMGNIIEAAKKDGDTHVAILDRHSIHSTIFLAKKAQEAGLEPMIGFEVDPAVTLWPTSHKGLRNLNKVATYQSQHGGMAALQECDLTDLVAVVNEPHMLDWEFFAPIDCYIEINEFDDDARKQMLEMFAEKHGHKIIPTATVLYNDRSEALTHDYFHNYIHKDGFHLPSDRYFIKSKADFEKWAKPEWIKNVDDLAQRVKLEVVLGKLRLPEFDRAPEGVTNFEHLEGKCLMQLDDLGNTGGLSSKFSMQDYKDRLANELKDVKNAGLESYFLIVEDICNFARNNGIKKGRGRGSGAGSLICYLLDITGIDPLEYGLIWERFYNAGRAGALPDIDTDFEKERREEVIQYMADRWGHDSVYQIITFGSYGPAKAITTVFSIGQCGFEETKGVTKLVHHKAKSIDDALKMSPGLREEAERRKALFKIARQLEGSYDSFGKHAAAVIIGDEPYTNGGLPMVWHEDDKRYIAGYDMKAIDDYGLLKVDILGLNTLNIIKRTEELVRERHDPDFDIRNIDLNDEAVYENIFDKGDTKCIFQLESQLGRKYSMLLKPRNMEDLSALVTVVRPGAMDSGQTQHYLDVRDGKKENDHPHPALDKILETTHGACIYQEQVMFICTEVAGLDLKAADTIRKAAGKKIEKLMNEQKSVFMAGCKKQGVAESVGETLWGWIVKFSGYGFNKSHAVCYAFLSYETAWLKHHYPLEFFEANCNLCVQDLHRSEAEKRREVIYNAKESGYDVLLPSIKHANAKFEIVDEKKLRYGLTFIKGVGDGQIPIIEQVKDAETYSDFLSGALVNGMKKNVVEALICAGALDHYGLTRNTMLADFELVKSLTDREYNSVVKEVDGRSVVDVIKEMADEASVADRKAAKVVVPNVRRREKLRNIISDYASKDKFESILHIAMYEREYLGCDISVNETDSFFSSVSHNLAEIKKLPAHTQMRVKTAVHIDAVRKTVTKRGKNPGQEMAFLTGSDGTAIYDQMVIFPQQYERFKNLLQEGRVVFIDGQLSNSGGLIVNNIGILK